VFFFFFLGKKSFIIFELFVFNDMKKSRKKVMNKRREEGFSFF